MLKLRFSAVAVFVFILSLSSSLLIVQAQDTTTRDPLQLAENLLGYDGSAAIPEPTPAYQPGDSASFWVAKVGQDSPTQITAVLAASTPGLYIWVEQGLAYNTDKMKTMADNLDAVFTLLRITDNMGIITTVPQSQAELATLKLLTIPDVDNDPHLFILYAQDLNSTQATFFNPNDSLPVQLAPGGYSNQHELISANVSALPKVDLDNGSYLTLLTRQMITMLAFYNNPHQAPWLREALAASLILQTQQRSLAQGDLTPFFKTPQTPLTQLPGLSSQGEEYGAGQLFLYYMLQRFGSAVVHDLFLQPGDGLAAVDRVLQNHGVTDLVTGEAITADDVFADFVMTNILNQPFGDGRYVYRGLTAADGLIANAPLGTDNFNFQLPDAAVNQLGSSYLALRSTTGVDFTLSFQGQAQAAVLRAPGDIDNHFYWSGTDLNAHTSLTHSFDLSGVDKATLNFDAWYNLIDRWNYAYVEVSDDGGKQWSILPSANTTTVNPYALSYGAGFTGISNPEGTRPFPYLGIGLDTDGLTITSIVEDSPLVGSDVQVGDTIAGYDRHLWQGTPNLINFLSNFKPGDTVNLHMKRGSDFYDVDVVLGTHPTRVFLPNPLWLPQQIDLSAYAGKQILVRFAYVSAADREDKGFALDNISIAEIGFSDDAESGVQGWTLNGWQQMTNSIPQRFLVQVAQLDANGTAKSVQQLIGSQDRVTEGSWDFSLAANEFLLIAVSGLNDNTDIPARFTLAAQAQILSSS